MDPITVMILVQIALFLLAELIRPKPDIENQKPAALGDFKFPTATEGRAIPLIWGTVKQEGPNVVWYGDFSQRPITKGIKTGLFSHVRQVVGFQYFLGMQLALCRMAADSLLTVWIGKREVYSAQGINSPSLVNQGTGYKVGEVMTLVGGITERPAKVRVEETFATIAVRVSLLDAGKYMTFPSSPAATVGGGNGNATIAFTAGSAITHGQDLVIDCPELFGGSDLGNGGVEATMTFFSGTDTQVAPPYLASHAFAFDAVVAAGGTGYAVGDILTAQGGTFTAQAQVRVATLGVSNAVATVSVIDPGFYTVFPPNAVTMAGGGGSGCTLTLTPQPGFQGEGGVTPRYLRTCHLVNKAEAAYLGNSTSIEPWAFELRRIADPLGLGAEATVNGADMNPANVLYEFLTNTEWGLRQAASSVDVANFSAAGDTLFAEGNGFSMLLDRSLEGPRFLALLQEQISGHVIFNQLTGKWQINLARGGYDPNTLPLLSSANVVEVESFARSSWEDTTNQVRAKFADRDDGYKETSALAQDAANIEVLQGQVVPAEIEFPGVKNRVLANSLAWRALRVLSFPLAKANIIADRTMYAIQPGQLVAWTYDVGGESFVRMPFRVGDVDYGELADGRIRLSLVQDVFQASPGVFAPPGGTRWDPPESSLRPFDYQAIMEAPRAIVRRDPLTTGQVLDKLWCAARRKGPEVGFDIAERHAAGAPSGAFSVNGRVYGLMLVGRLQSALSRGSAVPLTSLVLTPGPDSQSALESAFVDSTDPTDLGSNLVNLLLVGGEFMLATSAQTSGGNVQLNGVYRGVMDSVQETHLAGAPAYLLHVAAGLGDSPLPAGNNVDVKLLPFSRSNQLSEASVTATALAMSNRVRRPYPPSRLSLDGTAWSGTTSMEANGSGPESFAIDVSDVRRRDYRTDDEAQALTADASAIFSDFPAVNTTTHKIAVRNAPAGANTLLFTTAAFSGTQKDVRRIEILKATDGVIPAGNPDLRFEVFSTHLHESVSRDSLVPLRHDFEVTTALTGQFNFGARLANVSSNSYTATTTGTFDLILSSAFTAGNVQVNVAGGGFVNVITAGNTTGSFSATSGDSILLRHTSTDSAALKQLDMDAAGAGTNGYMILHTP